VKEIKEAIEKFNNIIQHAAWSATPEEKPQTKYQEYPWEVKEQIKDKRKLRKAGR
jgi:CMP-N-acetylneuraminic acid synthetase